MPATTPDKTLTERAKESDKKNRIRAERAMSAIQIPSRRLPDSSTVVAAETVIQKLALIAWCYIIWEPTSERVSAIHKVLAIIDSPWHSLVESMTIATTLKAVYNALIERKRYATLAEQFKGFTVEWILDDMRTVWQLPVPKCAPAKRSEKVNRKDENTVGSPTPIQLRLYSTLFADMFAVGLVDHKTLLDILAQILDDEKNGPQMEIVIFDLMCRASTAGKPKIPVDFWRKAMGNGKEGDSRKRLPNRFVLAANQKVAVNRFVEDAKSKKAKCSIRTPKTGGELQEFLNLKCISMQREIEKLDRDF